MTLLVAHGLGRFAHEWLACARAIDSEALVPDLPMLRATEAAPDHAAAIAALLAELDRHSIAAATWLGHSGGAHVALDAAVEYPERVDALVLVAAVPSRAQLARVRCDVLVICGEHEPIALSGVTVETIANAGHDPHLDAPDAVAACVTAFRARAADRRR